MKMLGDIQIEAFLREYWQKKPLLIRQAFPDFISPVGKEDLFELAAEPCVESRIILEKTRKGPWQVQTGPFEQDELEALPSKKWTLLVQGLDHWLEEASDLLDHFRFIPNWRIDDIMASYAVDQGSVGPHYDHYDVFLLQAKGVRNWKVGPLCDEKSPRLEGTSLRILKTFETTEEWDLKPGDMLYLPPAFAHFGVARGECITLSIGFRTPTLSDIMNELGAYTSEHDLCFQLPDTSPTRPGNPGEITPDALNSVKALIEHSLYDTPHFADWFGSFSTRPKSEEIVVPPDVPLSEQDFQVVVSQAKTVCWNEGSRFSYSCLNGRLSLYVDGEVFKLPGDYLMAVQAMCSQRKTEIGLYYNELKQPFFSGLIRELHNIGSLYFE